jgi:hypothetical protein
MDLMSRRSVVTWISGLGMRHPFAMRAFLAATSL